MTERQASVEQFDAEMRRGLEALERGRDMLEYGLSVFRESGSADLVALHEDALARNAEHTANLRAYVTRRA